MRPLYRRLVFILIFFFSYSIQCVAQAVSVTNPANTTPSLAATYTSLNNAITALNAITSISGPVIITLNAGNPQTAPAGGYEISFSATTSAVNTVTIRGNNNTITAFTPQTSGRTYDAIFKLLGVDYVTLENFVMQENASNATTSVSTNNMTEWGIALLHSSVTNGCQHNIIQNNTISLNKNYGNTFGIYMNNRHSATVPTIANEITDAINGPNSYNRFYGNAISNVNMGICLVGSAAAGFYDNQNDVGGYSSVTGNTFSNWGGRIQLTNYFTVSGTAYGIFLNNQINDNASYNSMISDVLGSVSLSARGIFKNYNTSPSGTFSTTINNNSITLRNNQTSGTTYNAIRVDGITSPLSTCDIYINNNQILNCTSENITTPVAFTAILNQSACGRLFVENNIIRGFSSTLASFTAINNTASVTTKVSIKNNQLGNNTSGLVSYSGSGGAVTGITTASGVAASVTIADNNFQGISQASLGAAQHTYISLTHAPLTASVDSIFNNTFTNLSLSTSGTVSFITRSGAMSLNAGHTEIVQQNSIVGSFSNAAAGICFLFNGGVSASLAGNTEIHSGNNFSNISLGANSTMNGWVSSNGSSIAEGPTKKLNGNTFSNWTLGSSPSTFVIQVNNAGSNTEILNNIVTNIQMGSGAAGVMSVISSGAGNRGSNLRIENNVISECNHEGSTGNLTGIQYVSTAVTSANISGNDLYAFTSTSSGGISGIRIGSGTGIGLIRNRVFDLKSTSSSSVVQGIEISSTTSGGNFTLLNNFVGDLRSTTADGTDMVRGIAINPSSAPVSTTYSVFYNTVYLNASSSGSNFGSSALLATGSGTATAGTLNLRNNILVNHSVPSGSGITVAYRRSNTSLANFSSNSNNNIFYAGTPSASQLIYYDGTNADQTLAGYKTRVGPTRDAASFTELPPFLNTTGPAADFLHLNPAIPTQAESGALNISGITVDYDDDIRQGNPGYTGTGTAPDIGADEINGIFTELNAPAISYTPVAALTCSTGDITLNAVTISDFLGCPISGTNRPRIYYRKNSGSWFSQPGTLTSGNSSNSIWSFTILAADMGGLTGGDLVSYYVIAQDLALTPNVGSNPSLGLVASGVNSVTTAPTFPNTVSINYNMGGLYTVGSGGQFPTLTSAVSAYNNACALSADIIFELLDNNYPSETYPITVLNHPDAASDRTLTIRPSTTASPVFSHSSSNPVLRLDGARYIRIDGRQAGLGVNRNIEFTNLGNGSTVVLINDAQLNIIRYARLRGSSTSTTQGVVLFSTSAVTGTGNDQNLVEFCAVYDGSATPANGITSIGTSGRENSQNQLIGNEVYNYFSASARSVGINLGNNNTTWQISGNRLYQSGPRVKTGASDHFGMWVQSGSQYTITSNRIGYADSAGTGTSLIMGAATVITGFPDLYTQVSGISTRFVGIYLNATTSALNTISQNSVGGIAFYTASISSSANGIFCGIFVESGSVQVESNSIGAETGNNNIYVTSTGNAGLVVGIRASSTLGSSSITGNRIGSITASGTSSLVSPSFTGISAAGPFNTLIEGNQVGHSGNQNIRLGYFTDGLGNLSASGQATSATANCLMSGIINNGTGQVNKVAGNIVRGWLNSSNLVTVTGIGSTSTMSIFSARVEIESNQLGTDATDWIRFAVPNSGPVSGVVVNNINPVVISLLSNRITGLSYGSTGSNSNLFTGFQVTGNPQSSCAATIRGNELANLDIRHNFISLISASYTLNSPGIRIIDSNRIAGSLQITTDVVNPTFSAINIASSASSGGRMDILENDFSEIDVTGAITGSTFYGLLDEEGLTSAGSRPEKRIRGNKFSNWQCAGAGFMGIATANMGGTLSQVSENEVSGILSSGADITGILIGNINNSSTLEVNQNRVYGFTLQTDGSVHGVQIENQLGAQTSVSQNEVYDLSVTGAATEVQGIHIGPLVVSVRADKNKIHGVSGKGINSQVQGFYIDGAPSVSLNNNLIGNLFAPDVDAVSIVNVSGVYMVFNPVVNLNHNTIYLNAVSASGRLNSAAVYASGVSAGLTMTNNILHNVSTPGSGRTVALWRTVTSLTNYATTSNRNNFYAGVPAVNRFVYFDGTNSDQTIAGFQARVGPVRESASLQEETIFSSTVGTASGFLHLDPAANCSLLGKGINVLLLPDDFDGDLRSTVSPFITDIGADEISKTNFWLGTVDASWNNASNWSDGLVPDDVLQQITIPAGTPFSPVIAAGQSFQVRNLTILTGATLQNRGELKIAGSVTAPDGSIDNLQAGIAEGSFLFNNSCSVSQVLDGKVFVSGKVKNLIIEENLTIATGIQPVQVAGNLHFGTATGKTLTTNNNLVLLSSQHATAGISDITGNQIAGELTVERYINTGLAVNGGHPKSWQFLAAPTQGQTIFQSWQEGGSATAGYGTWITGTGTGFDATTSVPAIKTYQAGGNLWQGLSTTLQPVHNSNGYMLFVRGDRTVTTVSGNPVPTILRTRGTVYQPLNPPPAVLVGAGLFASVANPYPSSLDLEYMRDNGQMINLNNDVTVWDPLLNGSYGYGGYQTLAAANNYEPTAGGTAYYPAGVSSPFIQSGQAFFVRSSGVAGSVQFSEASKESSSRLVFRPGMDQRNYFRVTVRNREGMILDGNAVVYATQYNNDINGDDARKYMYDGPMFSVKSNQSLLAVEARKSLESADTIQYSMKSFRAGNYVLAFAPKFLRGEVQEAWLCDRYLRTMQSISMGDSSFISFSIDSDTGSAREDRFYVLFKRKRRVQEGLITRSFAGQVSTGLKAEGFNVYPNPIVRGVSRITIKGWNAGKYQIQWLDARGVTVYSDNWDYDGRIGFYILNIGRNLAAGQYRIVIIRGDTVVGEVGVLLF